MPESLTIYLLLWLSALAAGVINSIAGGGTLLTFSALLMVVHPVVANATSTVALVPGSLAGAWGYRREMADCGRWAALLVWPSLIGGVVGSLLVTELDEHYFSVTVPWLLLLAALLFMIQPAVTRLAGIGHEHSAPTASTVAGVVVFQFFVAVYGGYFGAGIGILMLSALGLMGFGNIHRMNALKSLLAACINGVSAVVFVAERKVEWRFALSMTVAAILGGYLGARIARRLDAKVVRWMVVLIGLGLAAHFFYNQWQTTENNESKKPDAVLNGDCRLLCTGLPRTQEPCSSEPEASRRIASYFADASGSDNTSLDPVLAVNGYRPRTRRQRCSQKDRRC